MSQSTNHPDRAPLFIDRYGPWAVIAGAAEGLGAATAQALAQRGLHLYLLDRNRDALATTAEDLRRRYGVAVEARQVDLAEPHFVNELPNEPAIGLIVYVAAHAPLGPFATVPLADHQRALSVNCAGPIALVHRFLPSMVERGRGGVLLFSSLAGFQGSALLSTYAASKAFDLVLAESLAAELGPRGIDVAACCPGPTRTPAFERSAPRTIPTPVLSPEMVAEQAVAGLGRRTVVIPGFLNRLSRAALTLMGRQRAVGVVSRATLRMYPGHLA